MNPIEFADLSRLVLPRSIALVGASDRLESIGGRALENLTRFSDFRGTLSLVNPTRSSINGMRCVASVLDTEVAPDVAIIAVRADAVLATLRQCAERGVKFAVVFTSGFGEVDEAGKQAEAEMRRIAMTTGLRIVGPNCPGLNNINARLGFTFSPAFRTDQRPGPIGLATQGGGLGRTFVQAMERGVGTGLWFSPGNEVDLEIGDFIHYMAGAPDIRVIATTLEGVRNGPRFMEACLAAARQGKPVVAMKIGKSEYGIQAAQSHTAAIAGSAEVNSAVFRELGVIEVDDIDELIDTAALLSRGQPTGKEKVSVFCFSGGTAALAADKIGVAGLTLATFADDTTAALRSRLPPYASIVNPVDTTADILSNPELLAATLKTVCADPNTGLVLYPIPIEYGDVTTRAAESGVLAQQGADKPIVAVWLSDRLGEGYRRLVDGGLMPMRSMGKAVAAIERFVRCGKRRTEMDLAWRPLAISAPRESEAARASFTASEADGKALLRRAGINVPPGHVVQSAEAAAEAFVALGSGPVVMKVVSGRVTHKTEAGGVRLGIRDADAARAAFDDIRRSVSAFAGPEAVEGVLVEAALDGPFIEVVVGVHRDPVFGHICTFGSGGVGIELFKDVSRRLLPLSPASARAMVEETRCFELLKGYRGKPAGDIDALVRALLCVSDFVAAHAGAVEELEINPLAVSPQGLGVTALDAVMRLSNKDTLSW